jgi:hypothetical protein
VIKDITMDGPADCVGEEPPVMENIGDESA